MRLLIACFLLVLGGAAHAQIQVREPWSRETPPGAKIGVGFMEIRNQGAAAERVLSASTPLAGRVEMHVTRREGDVVRMRQVQSFDIAALSRIELRPGGSHLMLVDLVRPLKKGERVPLTLRLERAGEINVELEVRALFSREAPGRATTPGRP